MSIHKHFATVARKKAAGGGGSDPSVASTSTAQNTATITAPSGIQDGDLLLLFCHYSSSSSLTQPSGFTAIYDDDVYAGGDWKYGLYYKVASSESGNYTLTGSAAGDTTSGMLRISNASAVDVNDVTETGSGTSKVFPSVTTTVDNCLVIRFLALDSNTGTVTTPSGHTELFQLSETIGGDTRTYGCTRDALQASAGSTGTATATLSAARFAAALTVAVEP